MGAAVGANMVANGHTVLWVPTDRSESTARRAAEAGLTPAASLQDALSHAEVVLSICPPAVAREVADQVSEIGYAGLYVEANAISPEKYARISFLPGLGRVIDGAIIGPPPREVEARLYLAGPSELTAVVAGLFAGTRVTVRDVGSDIGAASALKMAFASFQKAARPLAAVAHALARKYDVGEFLAEEAATMPGDILAAVDAVPGVAARAWRWAPEMDEISQTLTSVGLPDVQARAAEAVLEMWGGDKDRRDLTITEVLGRLACDPERLVDLRALGRPPRYEIAMVPLLEDEPGNDGSLLVSVTSSAHRQAAQYFGKQFRRELGYTLEPYEATDAESETVLILSRFQASFPLAAGAAGLSRTDGGWLLTWIWLHPHERGRGLLDLAWDELEERFGEFAIEAPYSGAMRRFFDRRGVQPPRIDPEVEGRG
ncbi:hypothetical protein J2S48_000725 [Promicromonospora iranensis]|uniref:3-hydroxyisobutyrate dehydrogenase-like beta-hydroxyacid dehydrogenase n=2 Tax=Promicromonospora iranensis TaxID=1105144 RepID=A0ABU2CIP0_9MICO|nr:NAD(P)-dependent oxidoreductase [Promicromonospora iranensis]MDR7381210.1 hypothetical protein [Promicromonospora iranensis]